MNIIDIMPAIKIERDNAQTLYISSGDIIKILDFDGHTYKGIFLGMNLAKRIGHDGSLLLNANKLIRISTSEISDIKLIKRV